MLSLRGSLPLAVMATAIMISASVSFGQEVDADKAKNLLQQAVAQFNALKFKSAKAIFLEVNRDDLSEADKALLDEYLGTKVDPAIREQMAASAAYKSAEKSLAEGDLAKAKEGFSLAAASEYLPAATRQDAKAQLAMVEEKLKVAAAEAQDQKEPKAEQAEAGLPTTAPAESQAATQPAESQPAEVQDAGPAVTVDLKAAAAQTDRGLRVQELTALGQKALDDKQPDKAAAYFKQALALDPENTEAKRLLDAASGMTAGTEEGKEGIISRLEASRRIAHQVADFEFEKAMNRSSELLAKADSPTGFDAAAEAARGAKSAMETSRSLYTEKEYREGITKVDLQLEHIKQSRDEWNLKRVQDEAAEIAKQNADREARSREQRREKIATLTDRVKTLRADRKFEQAHDVVRQILNIDPTNDWAQEQAEILQQSILLSEEKKAHEDQRYNEQRQRLDGRVSEIPWWQELRYPQDWKELTRRRTGVSVTGGPETEMDREVQQKLRKEIARLEFPDTEFKDVISYLREVSEGLNFNVEWNILQAAGIDQTTPVSVLLEHVSLQKALQVVLDQVGGATPLGYIIDEGVITISTKDRLSAQTFIRTYDIRDLIVRVPNFVAPSMDLSAVGQNAGTNAGGNAGGNENNEENIPTKQEIIDNIITMVQETIASGSWRPTGDVGSIRELHGQLIVNQTAQNHKALSDLIGQLREARALQIAIEARFISVNSGFLNSIGLDLDFFINTGSRLGSTHVVDPFTGATVPTTGGTSGWGSSKPGDNKWTPIAIRQESSTFTNMVGVSTTVQNGIGGQVGSSALNIGGTFMDDIQVNFLIEATQAHSATRSLAAPRLTLYNGQRAYVTVATQQAYVADLTPVVAENAIAFNPVIGFVASGSVLDVEATVSADRRYVRLTVRPQVMAVNSFGRYAITTATTDAAGNPLTGTGFIQLPNVTVQRLETTVDVPDGGTLLLGGQRLSGEVEREMGVPLLNKIPIIKRAFANRGSVRDEQTLLILVKPKIIIHSEEEALQLAE